MSRSDVRRMCCHLILGLSACSAPRGDGPVDAAEAPDAPVDGSVALESDAPSRDAGSDAEPAICSRDEVGSIYGKLYDQRTFVPIAGATACVQNHPEVDCAVSNERGEYQIPCVPVGDVALTYDAAGYPREIWAWTSRFAIDEDVSLGLLHDDDNARILEPTGEPYPDGARSMIMIYWTGTADGATVALRRGTGTGAFYTRYEGGTLDPSVTSITRAGENAFLLAAAMPGEHEIELEIAPGPPATWCMQYPGGWRPRDGAENGLTMPVGAGPGPGLGGEGKLSVPVGFDRRLVS